MKLKLITASLLSLTSLLGLVACARGGFTTEITAEEVITTDVETTIEESTKMEEIKKNVSLDGKRVIFIGNSYVYYGRTVINKSSSVMTQAERENDKGFFYQLCR